MSLSIEQVEQEWATFESLSELEIEKAVNRFETVQPDISEFVYERLADHSNLAIQCALSHGFEAWWILDRLAHETGCHDACRDELDKAFESVENHASEPEPALAAMATSELWAQAAAAEDPLNEESIELIENVLKAIRMALRQS